MDAVITYVNGADPKWQEQYAAFSGREPSKRFRDWGTLRYLIAGIHRYMPFIDKIYLVVALESQVPEEVASEVCVVLHRDIIPAKFLPTFNSTTIEMFLWRIPGLSEKFIYFNDDVFPLRPTSEDDFFPSGMPAKKLSRHLFAFGGYKQQTLHSDRMARKAAGKAAGLTFVRPQHSVTPLLKSACAEVISKVGPEIEATLTPIRVHANLNQYVFTDYMYFTGKAVSRRISQKHLSLATNSAEDIARFIAAPTADFACINDVQMSEDRFLQSRSVILEAFATTFPDR